MNYRGYAFGETGFGNDRLLRLALDQRALAGFFLKSPAETIISRQKFRLAIKRLFLTLCNICLHRCRWLHRKISISTIYRISLFYNYNIWNGTFHAKKLLDLLGHKGRAIPSLFRCVFPSSLVCACLDKLLVVAEKLLRLFFKDEVSITREGSCGVG